jgi:hypothetical protein
MSFAQRVQSKLNGRYDAFYSSLDGNVWVILPDVTPTEVSTAHFVYSRFLGDPAFEYSIGK